MVNLNCFWGKTNSEESWYPAICHMIDVGVTAGELVKGLPGQMREKLADDLGVPVNELEKGLGFWVALHDIGKISPGFQWKVQRLCGELIRQGFYFPQERETNHGQVCMDTLPDILMNILGCTDDLAYGFSCILAAHHGVFPEGAGLSAGGGPWQEARVEMVKALADVFEINSLENLRLPANPVLMILAGLISVADWLGSREETFPFQNGAGDNLRHYLVQRRKIAKRVARELKMDTPRFEAQSFRELFGFDTPNSCQKSTIEAISQLTHPMVVIVESSMGSGKTEAALNGYAHISGQGKTRGLYYALPTQATGNAMLPRVKSFLEKLKVDNGAELHLLHSNADLNPDYEELRIAESQGHATDVSASSWFTARKRGVISSFGVGTIDQALMGVLKVRHFFVRLFGLSGKVLILDEVHAYDAYMQQEIVSLLGWIGQCGTSIVLLSATLTRSLRERLFRAFRPDAILPEGVLYPCVTGVDMKNAKVICRSIDDKGGPPIHVQTAVTSRAYRDARIIEVLKDKLSEGGSAACLMNTVKDAQRLYRKIKKAFPGDTHGLFHSRFRKGHRLAIEKNIIDTWGKNGGRNRPFRGIVVATQVIEQSVDVDFDFMISDLAPADLLLQRAGRLHRHNYPEDHEDYRERSGKLKSRTLVVMVPDYRERIPEFGETGMVYKKNILMYTALWLSRSGEEVSVEVNLPGNGVDWIEYVYGNDGTVPSHLVDSMVKWSDEHYVEKITHVFAANTDCLEPVHERPEDVSYLLGLNNDYDEEKKLSTRLGFKSVTLVLGPEPVKRPSREEVRSFISNSIDVSLKEIVEHFAEIESPAVWKEVAQLRYAKSITLVNGRVTDYPTLTYDDEVGLELHDSKGGDDNG